MNLEEFKDALSSEATKKNESLTKELSELRKKAATQASKIRELEELIKTQADDIRMLQNRCAANTRFVLCGMCGMKFRCQTLMDALTSTKQGGTSK